MSVMRCVGFVASAVMIAACSHGAHLRGRVEGLRELLTQAYENGAVRCAPRELALGEANVDFAQADLAQGDADRAEEHLNLAQLYARAAVDSSPRERCNPPPAPATPAPPPAPGDADGDGLTDPNDRCPNEPEDRDGFEDEDGCPEDQDTDGDGLRDSVDQCREVPEDADGYQDEDGCPDEDDDRDGIFDRVDGCPREPEDRDGFRDEDGCPDPDNDGDTVLDADDRCPLEAGLVEERGCPRTYENVQVTRTSIRILQQIHFQTNRAVIRPESFHILDTVTQVLRDFPAFRVEVQGHTDSRGNDNANMRLSQERADSVRRYLVDHGIDASRLTARGYGETQPLEPNLTDAGRAANRRVEFIRLDERSNTLQSAPAASP